MPLKNSLARYGAVAKTLHWLMFVLIAMMVAVGYIMEDMRMGPDKIRLIGLHKATGITILALVALRLGWCFINVTPRLPAFMKIYEKLAAHASHWLLYVLMFAMPLSGWVMSSASGFPVSVFGLFTLPDLVKPDRDLKHTMIWLHGWLAWVLIGLVTLHALAALLHHFYHKDNVLRRMLPFAQPVGEIDA